VRLEVEREGSQQVSANRDHGRSLVVWLCMKFIRCPFESRPTVAGALFGGRRTSLSVNFRTRFRVGSVFGSH